MTMTEQEAKAYDRTLKEYLEQAALQCGLEEAVGDYLADHYIIVQPDIPVKEMISLGDRAVSYKLGNIKIDMKKALVAGLELAASVNKPESVFNYIQLLIISVLFITKAMRQEAGEIETYIIYLLHRKGAYDNRGIEEEKFLCETQEWLREHKDIRVDRGEIVEAFNQLYKMQIADFENGNIYLKERVCGKADKM